MRPAVAGRCSLARRDARIVLSNALVTVPVVRHLMAVIDGAWLTPIHLVACHADLLAFERQLVVRMTIVMVVGTCRYEWNSEHDQGK